MIKKKRIQFYKQEQLNTINFRKNDLEDAEIKKMSNFKVTISPLSNLSANMMELFAKNWENCFLNADKNSKINLVFSFLKSKFCTFKFLPKEINNFATFFFFHFRIFKLKFPGKKMKTQK